jgi:hypothetical protein
MMLMPGFYRDRAPDWKIASLASPVVHNTFRQPFLAVADHRTGERKLAKDRNLDE